METAHCESCGRATGHKRALGWGTFFAVFVTLGFWLLALPFYPKRCVVCGTQASGVTQQASIGSDGFKRLLFIGGALVLFLFVAHLFSGASKDNTPASSEAHPGRIEVEVSAEPESSAKGTKIAGKTNLPDGSRLLLTLSRGKGYTAQDKATVLGGSFISAYFTDAHRHLSPGKYKLSIIMSVLDQNKTVRSLVGEHGGMLAGPLVHSDGARRNLVQYQTAVTIP